MFMCIGGSLLSHQTSRKAAPKFNVHHETKVERVVATLSGGVAKTSPGGVTRKPVSRARTGTPSRGLRAVQAGRGDAAHTSPGKTYGAALFARNQGRNVQAGRDFFC